MGGDLWMSENEHIVAFCCQHSAWKAVNKVFEEGNELPGIIHLIPVPCLERVNLDLIINSANDGAKVILVLGCRNGLCNNLYGYEKARVRVAEAKKILRKKGYTSLCIESHMINSDDYLNIIELMRNKLISNCQT